MRAYSVSRGHDLASHRVRAQLDGIQPVLLR